MKLVGDADYKMQQETLHDTKYNQYLSIICRDTWDVDSTLRSFWKV